MGCREALHGEGTRELAGVLTGVLTVENTTAGGRQPYGLLGSLTGDTGLCMSSVAGGDGTVPGIDDE
jgi:hypothetical protein